MKLIRNNTFETNSSSTHAIAIPKKSNYKIQKHVDFHWGEFGWEYEVYYDTSSKASYLYTMIRYFNGDYIKEHNKANEYISKIRQYLDEENNEIRNNATAIHYNYNLNINLYKENGEKHLFLEDYDQED